jgi:hypothetical protein
LKYDADDDAEGSTEERTLGRGVVFLLRGAAEGLDPGFALPLLLTLEGAMVGIWRWTVVRGRRAPVDAGRGGGALRGGACDGGAYQCGSLLWVKAVVI